jgi:tungstate transport system permease protein
MQLLYSVPAMVTAQVVLITPIVAGHTANIAGARFGQISETVRGVGISSAMSFFYTLYECRKQMVVVLLTGFGRAVSEVGAVQIVGGNIQFKTRVMTTTIMMVTNMGRFHVAIALGVVLLLIAFGVNGVAHYFSKERES